MTFKKLDRSANMGVLDKVLDFLKLSDDDYEDDDFFGEDEFEEEKLFQKR